MNDKIHVDLGNVGYKYWSDLIDLMTLENMRLALKLLNNGATLEQAIKIVVEPR